MFTIGEVKNQSGIYKITNIVNGKVYVGSAVDLRLRRNTHKTQLNNKKHCNIHLQKSWDKYGEDKFTFSVLEFIFDKDKLIEREQFWMDFYNVCDIKFGYNISPTAGNSLGRKMTDEQIKINRLRKKRKPFFQFDFEGNLIKEWISIGEMHREINVTRRSVEYALRNKNKFMENYYLISKDEFTEELLNVVLLGKKRKGNRVTNENKRKKVNQYDKSGTFIQMWDSIKLASETLKINQAHIVQCCKGKSKTSGGFIWSYSN